MIETISVISSAVVAVGSLVSNIVIQYRASVMASDQKRRELYLSNHLKIYNDFISAYANLHMLKDVSEQRQFLSALYAAIGVAPDDLKEELTKLLPMDSVSAIKPDDENRKIFFKCLQLINQHNSRNI